MSPSNTVYVVVLGPRTRYRPSTISTIKCPTRIWPRNMQMRLPMQHRRSFKLNFFSVWEPDGRVVVEWVILRRVVKRRWLAFRNEMFLGTLEPYTKERSGTDTEDLLQLLTDSLLSKHKSPTRILEPSWDVKWKSTKKSHHQHGIRYCSSFAR